MKRLLSKLTFSALALAPWVAQAGSLILFEAHDQQPLEKLSKYIGPIAKEHPGDVVVIIKGGQVARLADAAWMKKIAGLGAAGALVKVCSSAPGAQALKLEKTPNVEVFDDKQSYINEKLGSRNRIYRIACAKHED